MIRLHAERAIAAPRAAVFAWLTDAGNLTTAPLFLRAGWVQGYKEPGVGAVREVTAAGAWLRERITAFDPPGSYSYLVFRSIPAAQHEGGTVTCTPSDGGTHVVWESTYSIPLKGGGRFTELITAPLFGWSFRRILAACARELERQSGLP